MSELLKHELQQLLLNHQIPDILSDKLIDGILLIDCNNPSLIWCSSHFWNILGYHDDECKPYPCWIECLIEEDALMLQSRMQNITSMPHFSEHVLRYLHKDGSIVYSKCRSVMIYDEFNQPYRILSLQTDITQLKKTQSVLEDIKHEYDMVFEGTQDVIFLVKVNEDDSFTYVRANQALQEKTGIPLQNIIGYSPISLLGPEAGMQLNLYYQRCVKIRETISFEQVFDLPKGKSTWWTTLTPVMKQGKVMYIVGTSSDISDRKHLESQLIQLANHDSLTTLPNRRYFFAYVDANIGKRKPFTVLFCDLDGFKAINDNNGHDFGDLLLIEASSRLKHVVGPRGLVARFGGDEFVMLIDHELSVEQVKDIICEIRQAIIKPFTIKSTECIISISIGYAQYPVDGLSSRELIKHADMAMYKNKHNQS